MSVNLNVKKQNLKPKRVKISKQRQISIPKIFFEHLNFADEAMVEVSDDALVIRPVQAEVVDFSEFILQDLIAEGYSGDELLYKFKEVKNKLPQEIEKMSEEAMNSNSLTEGMTLDEILDETKDE